MKLNQIKEIIDVILNIPNEDYISSRSCMFKNRILDWDIYNCSIYSIDKTNNQYEFNLRVSDLENKHYTYSNISFNSSDLYDLLIERSKEITEYLDNEMYNFITKD